MKRVGQISSAERGTMITMALCVSAGGNKIPPMFLFPRKHLASTFLDNTLDQTLGIANESGWMKQDEFYEFMLHFIQFSGASLGNPQLLLLDNHASHLSVAALDAAMRNGVTILSFPPHCSHRLQPLDVSVFGPLKKYYSTECADWLKNNVGKALEIRHIAGLASKAIALALLPATIMSGFRITGICPFNRNAFTDADFVQASVSGENETAASIDKGLDEDDQTLIVLDNTTTFVAANEEVSTSEPSTSSLSRTVSLASVEPSTSSLSRTVSVTSVLEETRPLTPAKNQNKGKRGRKPMKSAILTSPEVFGELQENRKKKVEAAALKEAEATAKAAAKKKAAELKVLKAAEKMAKAAAKSAAKEKAAALKAAKAAAKACDTKKNPKKPTKDGKKNPPPAKRARRDPSTSDEDDFCIICLHPLPAMLNRKNSIKCNTCKRPVHLKCADLTAGFYICKHCDSDLDD